MAVWYAFGWGCLIGFFSGALVLGGLVMLGERRRSIRKFPVQSSARKIGM